MHFFRFKQKVGDFDLVTEALGGSKMHRAGSDTSWRVNAASTAPAPGSPGLKRRSALRSPSPLNGSSAMTRLHVGPVGFRASVLQSQPSVKTCMHCIGPNRNERFEKKRVTKHAITQVTSLADEATFLSPDSWEATMAQRPGVTQCAPSCRMRTSDGVSATGKGPASPGEGRV